jgi:hypothetical protein
VSLVKSSVLSLVRVYQLAATILWFRTDKECLHQRRVREDHALGVLASIERYDNKPTQGQHQLPFGPGYPSADLVRVLSSNGICDL